MPSASTKLYEETSLIFLGLALVSHAAFAVLCGAGLVGVGLLVLSWIYFGRILVLLEGIIAPQPL